MRAKILIIDEERNPMEVLRGIFRHLDYKVKICSEREDAKAEIQTGEYGLIVCNLSVIEQWQDKNNLMLLSQEQHIPFIVTGDYSSLGVMEEIVNQGAFASLLKPFRESDVLSVLERAIECRNAYLDSLNQVEKTLSCGALIHYGRFIGEHPKMKTLYSQIEKIAATDLTVLVRGESGTGKELVAKAIHEKSGRRGCPFVAVNCASLSDTLLESELFGHVKGAFTGAIRNKEGLFEAANGGTLFLDEIGTISPNMQQVLLRVLEEKRIRPVGSTECISVDVRVISATNENMEQQVKAGHFRLDLFHRLSVLPIYLPALRERPTDIPLLLSYFSEKMNQPLSFTAEAMKFLSAYPWPGNVRELENLVRRTSTLSDTGTVIGLEGLPEEIRQSPLSRETIAITEPPLDLGIALTLKSYLHQCERFYLRKVLEGNQGNKEKTAKTLGISLATFYRKYEEE